MQGQGLYQGHDIQLVLPGKVPGTLRRDYKTGWSFPRTSPCYARVPGGRDNN